ncbi:MAG TPA: hypothetical protein PKY96_10545 [Flavobacteriales bacterium]|nr:hypothetical protein [Flavobacteriales bacterium]
MRSLAITVGAIACALLLSPAQTYAQASMSSILTGKTTLTWVGIDFSHVQLATRADFGDLENAGPGYFARWNYLLEQEPAKFDMTGALKLGYVKHVTSVVQPINDAIDISKCFPVTIQAFDRERVHDMIARYDMSGFEGAGVVLLAHSMSKPALRGEFVVVFFDAQTKEVLHAEQISGKPMGFGLRNFWAGAVANVIKEINGTYQKAWEAKYVKGK